MWQQERSFNQLEPIETQQYQVTSNDRHHSSPYYDSRHRRLQPLARSPAVGWIGLYVRQHYVRVFLYVSLSVSVCFCLSLCLSPSVSLYIRMFPSLYVCFRLSPSVVSVYRSVSLSVSVCFSESPYVSVSLCLFLFVSVCFCLSPPASIFACLSLSLCEPIVPLFIRCARISESMYISLRAIVFPS